MAGSYPSISIRSSSPVCSRPTSPPALCAVRDEVNYARATGCGGVSPAIPVLELSTETDRKFVHLPDCQLPLKKRKIHEETVSDDGKSPIPDFAENVEPPTDEAVSAVHVALQPDEDGDLPLHIAVVRDEYTVAVNLMKVMSILDASLDCYNRLKQTPLHLAVLTSNVRLVRVLMSAGASPNVVDRNGLTCIHHAAQLPAADCLRCLLDDSNCVANIEAMNYDGLTALHLAAQHGNMTAVDVLLRVGAQIDACDGKNGRTALFYAVERNDSPLVALLLTRGANPAVTTYSGCTAVQVAASSRCSTELLQLLENFGACSTGNAMRFEAQWCPAATG
jgi:ankyrin repeat protein